MKRVQLYIFREVLKPLFVIAVILAGLFASFSSARYLAQAVTEILGTEMIVKLVFLKTLIAMEVLFPIALYASVIYCFRQVISRSGNSRIAFHWDWRILYSQDYFYTGLAFGNPGRTAFNICKTMGL